MSENPSSRDLVLVVDDDPDALAMIMDALTQAGLASVSAASGEAALASLANLQPNLIVLDALMPGLDGFETCRRIKGEERYAHLPVLFMTGLKDSESVLAGLAAGGVDYVTKPVNLAELVARVRIHIANSRVAFGARVALDATGRHLLATGSDGRIRWATPQASRLIVECFPGLNPGRPELPDPVVAVTAGLIKAAPPDSAPHALIDATPPLWLTFLGPSGGEEYLFRLSADGPKSEDDRLRDALGLTSREAEVLIWIARGKSNREISDILLISPRTVNKHLERVFAKLGVENRASATSVALRALGGPE